MSEDQLKVFLAKLKEEQILKAQLLAEGADIVSLAKVAANFIESKKGDNGVDIRQLSDQEINDQIKAALTTSNQASISPLLLWASILTVLLVSIGVFLYIKY